jgi:hypothetical protein
MSFMVPHHSHTAGVDQRMVVRFHGGSIMNMKDVDIAWDHHTLDCRWGFVVDQCVSAANKK